MAGRLEFDEQVLEPPADQLLGLGAEQNCGRRIGFHDARRPRIEDQDRFRGQLIKQAVSLLRVADPDVFALHLLLRLDEALLQRGHRPKIPPDDDDATVLAETERPVTDGDVGPAVSWMVDLSPARRKLSGIADELLDLRAAFIRDRVDETPADPLASRGGGQVPVGEGGVENHPGPVENERHVGGRGQQASRIPGIESPQQFAGGRELTRGRRTCTFDHEFAPQIEDQV